MTLPDKKLTAKEVKSIIERWSELGIDEAFSNAELKAQLVDLLAELDCPKWLAQISVKMLTPVFLYLAKKANTRIHKKSLDRTIARLLKVPGIERFFKAMDALEGRLLEQADAKKQFRAFLKEQSPTAHDLNDLLDPGLAGQIALLEQSSEMIDGIAELKMILESNANPQPLLELHLDPASDTSRFIYRSRAIPFVDDGESLARLKAFRDCKEIFSWYLVIGSGGTGKSRLALEFLLDHAGEYSSFAGFLNMANDPNFDWGRWQPLFPTIIVIDYAQRQAADVERMFELLSARKDLDWPVRVLLLERQASGPWYERILHTGRAARNRVEDCAFDVPLELLAPDDVWSIIEYIVGNRRDDLKPDQALQTLETIDPQMRPLYAAFMADALASGEDPRGWERRALVENVLDRERVNYWQRAEVTKADLTLVAVATMTAGYPLDLLPHDESFESADHLPSVREQNLPQRLSAIFGYDVIEAVPPLEPDILGEVFVLEEWKKASPDRKDFFVHVGGQLAPWFADFFSRLTGDFPADVPHDLIKRIVLAEFGEYEPTRSEMIYNTIMDFAAERPQDALGLYDAFLDIELSGDEARDNLINDQMEGAHNLMVGLPETMIEERMTVLEKAHTQLMSRETHDSHKARFCEILSAFVDTVDGLDVGRFEPVAKDVLSFAVSGTNDEDLRREALLALSSYVMAHSEEYPQKAVYWYGLVEEQCRHLSDETELEAWTEAAYHNYVLYRLKREHGEGTAFLQRLEDMGATFAQDLEDRYQDALRSLKVKCSPGSTSPSRKN